MNRFLAADYKPTEMEVVVQYSVLPLQKDSFHECLHHLVGNLHLSKGPDEKQPQVFDLNQESSQCKISFPEELFEHGNIAQNLSVIGGRIFDQRKFGSVKVLSIRWSKSLEQQFQGPSKGLKKIRELLNIYERPLSSGLLFPNAPLATKEYLEKAYLMWMGGCDMVVENDIMASQPTSTFSERIDYLSKESVSCGGRNKKVKTYIPNITGGTLEEMYRRARIAKDAGLQIVSVNLTYVGFLGLHSLMHHCQQLSLGILGTQQGLGGMTNHHSGYSSAALASLYRLLGIDILNLDLGSLETKAEIKSLTEFKENTVSAFPLCSGNSGNIENLIKNYGYDLIIQADESIYDHPDGVKSGAEAFQYAIETATQGIELETASKKNEPLRRALEHRVNVVTRT